MQRRRPVAWALLALAAFASIADDRFAQGVAAHPAEALAPAVQRDAWGGLDDSQARLLEIGYRAVSSMPLEPHVKNRSRGQESIVLACFELDAPELALGYAEGIENWRRGAAYADHALHLALNGGDPVRVQASLARAEEIAAWPLSEFRQAWRRERILSKIGQVRVVLREQAEEAEDGPVGLKVVNEETARVRVAEAMAVVDEDQREALLTDLETRLANGHGDVAPMTTFASALMVLHGRAYGDDTGRQRIEGSIQGSLPNMPRSLGIQLLAELASNCVENDDFDSALVFLDEAQGMLDEVSWAPEDRIKLQASLAAERARAGDLERALEQTKGALARFARDRNEIVDIWRADALVPVAEAYLAIGGTEGERLAVSVYQRALRESLTNQNPWPRSEDLAGICISLAKNGVEPDERFWRQLVQALESIQGAW